MNKQIIRATVPFVVEITAIDGRYDYTVLLWGVIRGGGTHNGKYATEREAKRAARASIKSICSYQSGN